MNEIILELEGLNCASCADKIETRTRELEGVNSANLDFVSKKLKIKTEDEENKNKIVEKAKQIVKSLEPDVKVTDMTDKSSHGHSHEHSHQHGDVHKKDIIKVIVASILFAVPFIVKLEGNSRLLVFLITYLIVGYDVIIRAIKNIMGGVPFDENFLMTIATIGAFIIGEYPEGVAVMLFYQVGELFQDLAVNNSRKSIESLMDIRPDYANLINGEEVIVADPTDVHIGNHILIKPGEKIPLDGVITEGESTLDTSNITGESLPSKVSQGDEIFSGSVNHEGLLRVKVSKEFEDSTVSKILDLVENASSKKAPTENFITKFARYYTPAVVFIALGIGILPTLLFGQDLQEWAYKSFVFLVMSCPCALVISIPLGFFGGIGAASKEGVLIKGGNYLEALNDVDKIVFDKTGTITKGIFKVTDVISYGDYSEEKILELGAYGEVYSNHPIGKSIVDFYNKTINKDYIKDYQEITGKGIQVEIDEAQIVLGNKKLFEDNSIPITEEDSIGTVVYIGKDKEHIGTIVVSDQLKDGVIDHLQDLKKSGVKETIMLSGDNEETTKKVGELASIDKVYGNLLPQDKVSKFEEILAEKTGKEKIIFVGDGVNDAPVLARADIGIAMGALGSDAAIEASDMVIMTDEISKISTGMKIAKKTKRIVIQNIAIAIGVKLVVLGLGVLGKATMWQAVFADVGVSVIAILNAIRALKVEE